MEDIIIHILKGYVNGEEVAKWLEENDNFYDRLKSQVGEFQAKKLVGRYSDFQEWLDTKEGLPYSNSVETFEKWEAGELT